MKQATPNQLNQPKDPNRDHMTVEDIWNAFADNLKEWKIFLSSKDNRLFRRVSASAKWGWISFCKWWAAVRRDLRHQMHADHHAAHHRFFPESESRLVQLLLFLAGSVPHISGQIREDLHLRRKQRIHHRGLIRAAFERMKLHPVTFLSATLAVALVCGVLSVFTVGVNVSYNGYHLGVASSRRAVRSAIEDIESVTQSTLQNMDYAVDASMIDMETLIVPRRVVEDREEIENDLTAELGQVALAYVLYVDGSPIVATTYEGALDELLDQMKLGYITSDTVECYFLEDVEIRQEYVDASFVKNLGYIAETLNETKSAEVTYTIRDGDAPLSIADKCGLDLDTLKSMNPGYNWAVLRVGDVLTVSRAVPYLTVANVERQNYVQDVPYDVIYEDDDSMYQGETSVISKGTLGKADISANVTYINGEETKREIVSSVTLSAPIAETQKRGTKERPSWFPTGSFGWPCNGVVTSRFGYRNTGIRGASTYHEGIDIANGKGTPIYASDGGTVTYSGWSGGYGYLIIIDHGNGYQTYYGHNSSLLVSVGAHVYKGQQIAKMGSTGVSSGSHCDFRIKRNGTFVNPLNYL